MKALMNTAPVLTGENLNSLFQDFVKWIDRTPKTTETYLSNLRRFSEWMDQQGITAPTRDDILAYRDGLQTSKKSINTINGYLGSLRVFFQWTEAMGIYPDITKNIHSLKSDPNYRAKDALEGSQLREIEQKLIDDHREKEEEARTALKDSAGKTQRASEQGLRDLTMYQLASVCGLRTIEISRLNTEDFQSRGSHSVIMVWGKGHSAPDQCKALPDEIAENLRRYLETRKAGAAVGDPLFTATGNRNASGRIDSRTISAILKRSMKAAGYDSERLTAHSLRHSAGTMAMTEADGNIYEVQQYMRHADPSVTEIYVHTDNLNADAEMAQKIYDRIHGTSEPEGTVTVSLEDLMEQIIKLQKLSKAV